DYDYIETSWLKEVPEYYEIVEPGKVTIGEDNTAEVVVRKTMKNVIVNFVDESGNPVLSTDIKVESDATYFHTSLIQDKIPSGWELKEAGNVEIVDNTATVVLREKAHTKDVTVNYVTEDGENVGTESVTVEKDYDYIETSWLKEVPEYYEIVEPGKVTIGEDNTAEVVVRKTMKNVIVNFVDESGNLVFSTDIEVESDATYFHTSLIQDKIPSGWELKEVGDIAIAEDNTATVVLRASKKPEEPNKPEEPDKPEKPEKPNKPENPDKPSDSDRPSESEKPSDSHKVPMTGDQSPVGMAALGLLASMGLLISRKRK
ncbi:MAG: LPXTG cell wall anchor domain-containing protein, partial [Mediterraneibacter gnavus]